MRRSEGPNRQDAHPARETTHPPTSSPCGISRFRRSGGTPSCVEWRRRTWRSSSPLPASGEEARRGFRVHRSYEDQRLSYGRLVSTYGTGADKASAPRAQSQHQLGTAVDFKSGFMGYEARRSFGSTGASRWPTVQVREYGFVPAYPPARRPRRSTGGKP